MSQLSDFLHSFPAESAEREYHGAIASILEDIEFDAGNCDAGIGLLDFLDHHNFVTKTINTGNHPIAGSMDEDALLVDAVFADPQMGAIWWKQNSSRFARVPDPQAVKWRNWWKQQFEESSQVLEVY